MLKKLVIVTVIFFFFSNAVFAQIGNCGTVDYYHSKVLDGDMHLDSWHKDSNGPFEYIINSSALWWKDSPHINGWPCWCTASIIDRKYNQSNGALPGSVGAYVIISCLKYYIYTGDTTYLNMARETGNFIILHDLTPSNYQSYPDFPYAVGITGSISPEGNGHPDSLSTLNPHGHIQPDKGSMVGVSLLELYKVTGSKKYLNSAINIANCLSKNAIQGTELNSPWPMRVMADNGNIIDGVFSANVSFSCRLFDELLRMGQTGNGLYLITRDSVWSWLKKNVIVYDDASKWKNFFEDHNGDEDNPLQVNALETVRYLLEKGENADPEWFSLAGKIINQVQRRWALTSLDKEGYVCIAEQQTDLSPYNSHTARYGSILAMYYEAGASIEYKDIAYHSLCYGIYSIENNGFTSTYYKSEKDAWTTDSFGDFLGHYIDAFAAVPEWAGNGNHLLRSSGTIKQVSYIGTNRILYKTYDDSGIEKLKLKDEPISITINGRLISSYNWDDITNILLINRSGGANVDITLPVTSFSPNSNKVEQSFVIYPNPVKDKLTISLQSGFENSKVSIYDFEGRILYKDVLKLTQNNINVSFLNKGVYLITISKGSEIFKQKLIKE